MQDYQEGTIMYCVLLHRCLYGMFFIKVGAAGGIYLLNKFININSSVTFTNISTEANDFLP